MFCRPAFHGRILNDKNRTGNLISILQNMTWLLHLLRLFEPSRTHLSFGRFNLIKVKTFKAVKAVKWSTMVSAIVVIFVDAHKAL